MVVSPWALTSPSCYDIEEENCSVIVWKTTVKGFNNLTKEGEVVGYVTSQGNIDFENVCDM